MSNLEAHYHPHTETVAHPLRNLFILPTLWFFLHVGLFHFMFLGPCVAPPTNLLSILISFIFVGVAWRSLGASRKYILHAKRWWVHLLFYFYYFSFSLFFHLFSSSFPFFSNFFYCMQNKLRVLIYLFILFLFF